MSGFGLRSEGVVLAAWAGEGFWKWNEAESTGFLRGSDRPLSSSFLGLPYGIRIIHHEKEQLRGLWVLTWFGL